MSSADDMEFEPDEPPSGKGVIVTRADLARWTGQSATTVDHWLKEGLPVVQRATKRQPYKICSADFFAWYRDRLRGGKDVSAAKLAALEVSTKLRRLELAEREGSLVPIEAVLNDWVKQLAAFRGAVLSIHTQVPGLSVEQQQQLRRGELDALRSMRAFLAQQIRESAAIDGVEAPDVDDEDEDEDEWDDRTESEFEHVDGVADSKVGDPQSA